MGKTSRLPPGFRFHPTDIELVMYYLKKKVTRTRFCTEPVAEIDIYKFAPWDLPDRSSSKSGDLKWYFFCPVERKYLNGARMNRATEVGYWKTTGKDRPVHYSEELVGLIKTLIFHLGKAPGGQRTNWVMHEYRLEEKYLANNGIQNTHVLCRIFQKDGLGPRNGAQYGAPFKEDDWNDDDDENCVEAGLSVGLSTLTCVPSGNCSSLVMSVNSASVSESRSSETMRFDSEAGPSVRLSAPTCVLTRTCSSSVMAVNSALGGKVSESCLSETMRFDLEAGPSVRLSAPTCVVTGNCSSSVMAVNSALGGTVSESCLSETMQFDSEMLPASCTKNIVLKKLPQALDDGGILPAVLANDDDNILPKELPQVLGDGDILSDVLVNDDDNVLSVLASFMEDATLISNEDNKNKILSHGVTNDAAHYVDIFKELGDLGNTASLSKSGYNFYDGQQAIFPLDYCIDITDLDLPLDAFP